MDDFEGRQLTEEEQTIRDQLLDMVQKNKDRDGNDESSTDSELDSGLNESQFSSTEDSDSIE